MYIGSGKKRVPATAGRPAAARHAASNATAPRRALTPQPGASVGLVRGATMVFDPRCHTVTCCFVDPAPPSEGAETDVNERRGWGRKGAPEDGVAATASSNDEGAAGS